ncbi:hypothetical protein B7494_g1207 [Chlorociboria aeruginascens]|nr:hypothetical protein B7494_g1207 [Chlorociboria aeruginascens]
MIKVPPRHDLKDVLTLQQIRSTSKAIMKIVRFFVTLYLSLIIIASSQIHFDDNSNRFDFKQVQLINETLPILSASTVILFESEGPDIETSYHSQSCKVFPGDKNWPSDLTWSSLNDTLNNTLIKTTPLASPCYYDWNDYNSTTCASLTAKWTDPSIHMADPTSMMSPVYQGLTCQVNTDPTADCTLGGYPSYAVNVSNAAQIQLAVNFARETGIRLVIKNTGHDFSGKSGGAGAMSIWTHHLKDIDYFENYSDPDAKYEGPAFKAGSGVQAFEIYEAAHEKGLVVVGGEGKTVGVTGGYIQGGGHSPLGSLLGMAADHILSMDVVTPDGRLVTANFTQETDLFWALRGGGGSTFGVVVSMTLKAYPDLQVTASNFTFAAGGSVSTDTFWQGIRYYLDYFQEWSAEGIYAYWWMFPGPSFSMQPFWAPGKTLSETNAILAPWLKQLEDLNITVTPNTAHYDAFYPAWLESFPIEAIELTNTAVGSRLFPKRNWASEEALNTTFDAIKTSVEAGLIIIAFLIDPDRCPGCNNSVNPAWRNTYSHVIQSISWDEGAPAAVQLAARHNLTYGFQQNFRDVSPGAGSYLGESDILEPNFQQAFYGSNYERLLEIKKKVDPGDVFYATTAVGNLAQYPIRTPHISILLNPSGASLNRNWRVLKVKMARKAKKAAYVVFCGRKPGIYRDWEECEAQISRYSRAKFRGFDSWAAAQKEWDDWEWRVRNAGQMARGVADVMVRPVVETNIQENIRGPANAVIQPVFETNSIAYPGKDRVHASLSSVPGKRSQQVLDLTDSGGEDTERKETIPVKRLKSEANTPELGTLYIDLTLSNDEDDKDDHSDEQSSSDVEDAIDEQEDLSQYKALDPEVVGDKPIILTAAQQVVVEMALRGENIFLTGAAGSGKTATLRAILQRFEARYAAPSERHRKTIDKDAEEVIKYPPVQVVAPTGIAALPLCGKTTYSFAGWNQDSFLNPLADLLKDVKESVYKAMKALKVLIVEEISMVENQFLERLSALMKHVLESPRPFGGKQVIFLGDFHQLPPVKPFQSCINCGEPMTGVQVAPTCSSKDCKLYGHRFAPGDKWAFKAPVWAELKLKHVNLEQIHRQLDARFQIVLNKIRNGIRLTTQEWQALITRKTLPEGAFAIRLMSKLVKVRAFNEARLNSIKSKPESWNALDSSEKLFYTGEDKYRMNEISRKLKEYKDSLQEHRWPTNLVLKVGAKVVLLHNLSHARGLVNGSQGTVVGFADTSTWPVADTNSKKAERDAALIKAFQAASSFICPIVRFTNGRTETIMPVASESLRGPSADRYRVCRTQIPLGLAWALSIHKSQGMTLGYVEVSSQDIFESGQLYVGLSRAQRMDGLTVTGYRMEQIVMDQDVLEFYKNTKWESLGPSNIGLDVRIE